MNGTNKPRTRDLKKILQTVRICNSLATNWRKTSVILVDTFYSIGTVSIFPPKIPDYATVKYMLCQIPLWSFFTMVSQARMLQSQPDGPMLVSVDNYYLVIHASALES